MQVLSQSDIELELALGAEYRRERIERLRHQVAALDRAHQNSAVARRKLVLAMADQLRWENKRD